MQRITRFLATFLIFAFSLIVCPVSPDAQPFTPPFSQDGVLAYLEQIISVQQDAAVLKVDPDSARESILSDTLRQNTASVSQYGFDFARTQAAVLDKSPTVDEAAASATDATRQSEIDKFAVTVNERIAALQKELKSVNNRIRTIPVRQRQALLSRQQTLKGELNLAQAQLDLIKSISDTVTKTDETDTTTGLLRKINNLDRTVKSLAPDANNKKPDNGHADNKKDATKDAVAEKDTDNRGGLIHLGSDLFALWQKQTQLRNLKQDLNTLRSTTKDMRAELRTTLQTMAKSGNTLAHDNAAKSLDDQRQDFDTLVDNFKQLSASVVPLSQTNSALDATKLTLKDWQSLSDDMIKTTARQFLLHLALLGIAIAIPLGLSEFARRMTMRYVKDARRQRQVRFLRRIVVTIIVALIIALNLASELGSLATFAGFLTAGIAVALQNILLSLAAHFFFFGRYGVRSGDRVTVGGVTGDVTQVGMVRLYLMEIEGTGDETRPTGRIVAFPNSILFQPTAFFKHMPAA